MPYKKKAPRRPRRKFNRNKKKVAQGRTTRVIWFKSFLDITANPSGLIQFRMGGAQVTTAADWTREAQNWDEYKILKMIVKFIPSNVGAESQQQQAPPGAPRFDRGDFVTWIDTDSIAPLITGIDKVINQPSARLRDPRKTTVRWTTRPSGYPTWGGTTTAGTPGPLDDWSGSLNAFGIGFTGTRQFFYAQRMWKVIFRTRKYNL